MKIYQIITVLLVVTFGAQFANAAAPAAPQTLPNWLLNGGPTLNPKNHLTARLLVNVLRPLIACLKNYIIQLATSGQAEYITLAQQISNDLKIFNKLTGESLPASKLNKLPAEAEVLDWQKMVIRQERKQESQLRNQYLALGKTEAKIHNNWRKRQQLLRSFTWRKPYLKRSTP